MKFAQNELSGIVNRTMPVVQCTRLSRKVFKSFVFLFVEFFPMNRTICVENFSLGRYLITFFDFSV